MIHTLEIDLAALGVAFPHGGVGMVVAQPFLEFTAHEPFTCIPAAKDRLLHAVEATLHVAMQASHGAAKTHFTIFPECAIPGLEGVHLIDTAVTELAWPTQTVVIGGVDGLTKEQFSALVQNPGTHFDEVNNALDRIQQHEWVNCSITWVKLPTGEVQRWVQPKIAPAWVERNVQYQSMFQGRSVYVFKGMFDNNLSPFRFLSLLCFDWVAEIGGQRVWKWVVDSLSATALAAQAETPLSWVFVIQSNPQPSHASFLSQVERFFDQTIKANVLRDRACLVMANTAGSLQPGRVAEYGKSSVLHSASAQFTKPKCSPTYSNGGLKLRASGQLAQLKDALFREDGACVHSFFQTNPSSLVPGAAGKTFAISNAFVYPLDEHEDRRTPRAIVPAGIKWLNDDLDDACKSLATRFPEQTLSGQAEVCHGSSVQGLRALAAEAAESSLRLACPTAGLIPDDWALTESKALEHLVQTLTVLGLANVLTGVQGMPTHASVAMGAKELDMLAVRSESHQACEAHLKDNAPSAKRLIVVVSRDDENTEWPLRMQSFLRTRPEGDEIDITDPAGNLRYVGYRTLMDAFRAAQSEDELFGVMDDIFSS